MSYEPIPREFQVVARNAKGTDIWQSSEELTEREAFDMVTEIRQRGLWLAYYDTCINGPLPGADENVNVIPHMLVVRRVKK